MNTTAKIITGFLIGTMLGTLTGLLVAPSTGKRTRKNIEKKTRKFAKQVAGYLNDKGHRTHRTAAHSKNGKASVEA